jgi:hypothetical protein
MSDLDWWFAWCLIASLVVLAGLLASPIVVGWMDQMFPLNSAEAAKRDVLRDGGSIDHADLREKLEALDRSLEALDHEMKATKTKVDDTKRAFVAVRDEANEMLATGTSG